MPFTIVNKGQFSSMIYNQYIFKSNKTTCYQKKKTEHNIMSNKILA
jgi:hypothetical protein